MGVFESLLQGIIQGLSEFLPISSSGHLVLFQHFTGNSDENAMFFNLMLHLGTLIAVVAAYYEDLWAMLKELGRMVKEVFTGKFHFKTENPDRKMIYMLVLATLPMVLVVFFRKQVGALSNDGDIVFEGICFLITSGLLFLACKAKPGRAGIRKMKARHALIIGLVQDAATLPGISRSGSTVSAGLILGFDRAFMVKFSFLMGIPAILGGAVFEIGDAVKEGNAGIGFLPLFVGMLAAAVVGYLAIRLVRWLVVTNKFIVFAWYTLVLGAVVVIIGVIQHITGGAEGTEAATSAATSVASALAFMHGA